MLYPIVDLLEQIDVVLFIALLFMMHSFHDFLLHFYSERMLFRADGEGLRASIDMSIRRRFGKEIASGDGSCDPIYLL